jgi:hypothetical protein
MVVCRKSVPVVTREIPEFSNCARDAPARRDQGRYGKPDPLDQAQVVARKVEVEPLQGGGEAQHAGAAEQLELKR